MKKGFVDFHAHIIPFADHGCKTVQTAQKQLEYAARYGVSTIVATPHFYPHRHTVEKFLENRERGYSNLLPHLDNLGITVIKGAEVQLCIGLDKMQDIEKLCIDNTDILLVEIPDMPIVDEMYETLEALSRRFRILIAHIDRYSKKVADKLMQQNYMFQLNADALLSFKTFFRAIHFIKSKKVYALGSDIHGSDCMAYKRMYFAAKLLGAGADLILNRMQTLIFGKNYEL